MLQLQHFPGRAPAPDDRTQSRGLLFANTPMQYADVLMHFENPVQAHDSGYFQRHHSAHPATAAIPVNPAWWGHLQTAPPLSVPQERQHLLCSPRFARKMLPVNASNLHRPEQAWSQIYRLRAPESDLRACNAPRQVKPSRWDSLVQAWRQIEILPTPAENCLCAGSTNHANRAQWMNSDSSSWQPQDHFRLRPRLSAGAPPQAMPTHQHFSRP